jgi:hypothetical protein
VKHRVLLAIVLTASVQAEQTGANAGMRRLERQLTAILQWEILWGATPEGFQVPTRPVQLALVWDAAKDSISYCGREPGVCGHYFLNPSYNWDRLREAKCCEEQSDLNAVMAFSNQRPIGPESVVVPRTLTLDGPRGISGRFGSTLTWIMTADLGSHRDIVQSYRKVRPPELMSLKESLRMDLRTAGYRTVTIPCFKSTDPMVYLYGDRPAKGPIVIASVWDKESEEWRDSRLVIEGPENQAQIDQFKKTIDSVKCATVSFR